MRRPGIKPGSRPWQGRILSLYYRRSQAPSRGIEPRASAWQAEMLPTTPYRMAAGVSGFRSQYLVLAKHARFRLRQYPWSTSTGLAGDGRSLFFRVEKIKKPYSTWDSLVVPYQSTDQAQRCLTSQFGWDAVLSSWYDRMTRALKKICTSIFIFIFSSSKK